MLQINLLVLTCPVVAFLTEIINLSLKSRLLVAEYVLTEPPSNVILSVIPRRHFLPREESIIL